ncbi:MAG: SDR family NAD(P)-dependent oxidoreductase [Erythrobacter sp.]|uniref:SDR family NAD(P)-dependent oxidoreductase n=1 Tax=Erythrobacter sp. TaxID=1042 RepID=UPI0026090D4C|nr:SDR family NAD(P)-dependent oxidoreductase [Erythrobacter sp.]MDJ0978804.1 SDR family NAD(P)-dependent oxidoreductase [Erythrobacter sp.]
MEPYKDLSRSIAGHTAIITGAASGMGRASAHLFASQGAKVAVTDLDQAKCDAVAQEIAEAGYPGDALAMALDVTDPSAIETAIAAAVDAFGGLDIVVNNAGFARHALIEDEHYPQVWSDSLEAMLTAQQRIIRASLPHLRQSAHPRIVNIASTEGQGATPGNSPYVAAKHGVIGLTRGMAVDLGREGITVNCVCPGPIRTGITEAIPEEHKEIYAKRRVPLRRYGFPEEVAHITLSLVLPSASFITGAVIPVDGGLTIKNA